jgi:hypothetical protein
MPRQEHVLTIFLASPGDVQPEREKVEEVIRDFNDLWSRPFRIRLELVRWESHAYPDMGTDAQDVINNQIDDDYDIFLGIMWCRCGTPTGRATSGTVEEYYRARDRYKRDPSSVKLMFYFKNRKPTPPGADPDQVSKVQQFQEVVQSEGALSWTFSDVNDFGRLAGIHIARQVQKSGAFRTLFIEKSPVVEKSGESSTSPPVLAFSRSDELAPFAVLNEAHNVFMAQEAESIKHTARINGVLFAFKTRSDETAANINALTAMVKANPRNANATDRTMTLLLKQFETGMLDMAAGLEHEFPTYAAASGATIDAFIRSTAARIGLPLTERLAKSHEACLDMVVRWRDVTEQLQSATHTASISIGLIPDVTPGLAAAKRKAVLALGRHTSLRSSLLVLLREGEILIRDQLSATVPKNSAEH